MAHLSARDAAFTVETEGLRLRWPEFTDSSILGALLAELPDTARRDLSGLLGLAPHRSSGEHLVWAARRGNLTGGDLILLAEPRDGGALHGLIHVGHRDGRVRPRAFGPAREGVAREIWRPGALIALRAALRHAAPARVLSDA